MFSCRSLPLTPALLLVTRAHYEPRLLLPPKHRFLEESLGGSCYCSHHLQSWLTPQGARGSPTHPIHPRGRAHPQWSQGWVWAATESMSCEGTQNLEGEPVATTERVEDDTRKGCRAGVRESRGCGAQRAQGDSLHSQGPEVTERKDNYYRAGCKGRLFSPSSLKHKERAVC